MATKLKRRSTALLYFTFDVIVVLLFTVAGRDTRGSGAIGTLLEALPFLAGVAVGWVVSRAWRHPRAVRWSGIVIWIATVAVGLPIRTLVDDPTGSRFIVITCVSLGLFLLGWRAIAWIFEALFGRAIEKAVDDKYRR